MGKQVAAVMDAGKLVTDEIVIGLIAEQLDSATDAGIIFDGFPRTLAQADALGELLESKGQSLHAVVEMQVDDEALVERITGRFTCGECGEGYHDSFKKPAVDGKCDSCGAEGSFKRRPDDNEEALRTRLMAYYKDTSPLIGYYYAKNRLKRIDGLGEIDEVAARISGALEG